VILLVHVLVLIDTDDNMHGDEIKFGKCLKILLISNYTHVLHVVRMFSPG